jgi:Pyruvate/2-oxoacid:ferredoxin oxidoreductase delta subunit
VTFDALYGHKGTTAVAQKAPSLLIYCHCAYYQIIPDSVKTAVLNAIKASGVEFEAVPDLCRMCAKRDPRLKDWANAEPLRIFACYPRAVKWLFHAAGAPLPPQGVEFVNMRTGQVEEMVSLLHHRQIRGESADETRLEKEGDWIPWFPVIDYDLCENCKQCLGFCLFGVYELSDGDKVDVRNPANCKTNCPACARACPNSAIIFPKYGEGPINGDEVKERAFEDREVKANLTNLLSGDVYNAIRKRGKGGKRFSAGADAAEKVGLPGKSSSLKELQEKLAIPPEVLASLSPAEMIGIRKRAAEKTRRNTHQSPNETGKTESEDYE